MKTLHDTAARDEILSRLERLQPGGERRWGRMTPHQMLCHLSDSLRCAMGLRDASPARSFLNGTLIRWVALHTPIPGPRGYRTRPELDAQRGGSRPTDFDGIPRMLRPRRRAHGLLRGRAHRRGASPAAGPSPAPRRSTDERDRWRAAPPARQREAVRRLDLALRQSLAFDKGRRFASARQMRETLLPALAGCPRVGLGPPKADETETEAPAPD